MNFKCKTNETNSAKHSISLAVIATVAAASLSVDYAKAATDDKRPNVVIVISDDAGYADFSMHGSRHFPTPHIDSIASAGVRFAQGYVSSAVCSPSRAGLLTGRYQQRFGHHHNIPPAYSETNGLPLTEKTLADYLKAEGYRTIALGKWHLGYAPHFHPLSRGFTDYYGFLQGARSFWPLDKSTRLNRLLRDREPVDEDFEYMTDELGDQAAAYIDKYHRQPFFMYLAFNAVHTPMHATERDLAKVEAGMAPKRSTLAAMTIALDKAVGQVIEALRRNKVAKNTLLIFVNDNGGATSNASSNYPLRGAKGSCFEGGIRVPFAIQWPANLPSGTVFKHPVTARDLLPTALAAAGADLPENLDGVNLIPFLNGTSEDRPHQTLFWKRRDDGAVRDGDWKLVRDNGSEWMLFDLSKDPHEESDTADRQGDRVATLVAEYESWESELAEPRWPNKAGRRKKGRQKN